jgi:hypothetical protein
MKSIRAGRFRLLSPSELDRKKQEEDLKRRSTDKGGNKVILRSHGTYNEDLQYHYADYGSNKGSNLMNTEENDDLGSEIIRETHGEDEKKSAYFGKSGDGSKSGMTTDRNMWTLRSKTNQGGDMFKKETLRFSHRNTLIRKDGGPPLKDSLDSVGLKTGGSGKKIADDSDMAAIMAYDRVEEDFVNLQEEIEEISS